MRRFFIVVVTTLALFAGSAGFAASPAGAAELSFSEEAQFLQQINSLRSSKGLPSLQLMSSVTADARNHTFSMASAGTIFHTNNLSGGAPSGWTKLGENVGKGPSVSSLMGAFIGSSGHYRNLTDSSFTHIGIGVVRDGNMIYTTHRFVALPNSTPTNLPFAPSTPTAGTPPAPAPTGHGAETIGVVRGRDIFLRNSNSGGPADYVFAYGKAGDQLIFGDWDGNGTDTVGVQRGRELFLRNSNSGGPANYAFAYGKTGDTLVFGDWDGR